MRLLWLWPGVCVLVVNSPTWMRVWERPLGVLMLHTNSKWRSCVGEGKGSRRVGQQMLWWGLDCVVVSWKKWVRGVKDGVRGGMRGISLCSLMSYFRELWTIGKIISHCRDGKSVSNPHKSLFFCFLSYFYFFMSWSIIVRTSSRGAIAPHKRLPSSLCVPDRMCLCTCASHLYQAQRVVFKSSWPNTITLINPSRAVTSFRQCLTCLCCAARLHVWSLLLSLHANVL